MSSESDSQTPKWSKLRPARCWQRLSLACRAQLDYYVDRLVPGFDLHADALAPFIAFQNSSYFAIDARRYCDSRVRQ
jgi:hypothetical protein